MKKINDFRNYLLDDELKINVFENRVNIVNYDSIQNFDSEEVTIKHEKKLIIVKGQDLIVLRLMKEEVLITGEIKSIEFR